jgi:starch synthase
MRVLFVCAELYPYQKTGGLADVAAGLTAALRALGCDVRVLMPGFPALIKAAHASQAIAPLPTAPLPWGAAPVLAPADLVQVKLPGQVTPVYLLKSALLYHRPGNPYLGPDGLDWEDNGLRFAALGWAAASLGQGLDPAWVPDVIHGHDWHAGLAPAYVRAFADAGHPVPATVFTVHNLAYQGLFHRALLAALGLPSAQFEVQGLEFFGQVSFMKAGLNYADRLTTVSPTYADEIVSAPQGFGLEGVLRARAGDLSGILNGVDYAVWSPATDVFLSQTYDADTLADKALAKKKLQQDFGLAPRAKAMVVGVVSRLSAQKGLHLLPEVVEVLVQRGGQLALLGQGDAALEQALLSAAAKYPGQVSVRLGYDEATAHRVIAGADVIAVPSAFEPCGLTQLYGLRYGTLPLVRRVGGLADTVVDCSLENLDEDLATGFVFDALSAAGLSAALRRAFALYRRPSQWAAVQRRGMALRFDWPTAAKRYLAIYQSLKPGA